VFHLVGISDDVTYDVIVYVKIKQWTCEVPQEQQIIIKFLVS